MFWSNIFVVFVHICVPLGASSFESLKNRRLQKMIRDNELRERKINDGLPCSSACDRQGQCVCLCVCVSYKVSLGWCAASSVYWFNSRQETVSQTRLRPAHHPSAPLHTPDMALYHCSVCLVYVRVWCVCIQGKGKHCYLCYAG